MTFRLTLKTAPASEPITTAEAKKHLNVTTSDDDTYIDTLVTAARMHTENILRRALITQTWNLYLDAFKSPTELPKPPLVSVTSIKYIDTDGAEQTTATGVYTVDTDADPGQVYLSYDQTWPDARTIDKAIDIEYVAGYGAAADVPTAIKHAILLLVGHLYEHRETVADFQIHDVPMGYDALLWPYRVTTL
jgi:uncharacterized phiE125 gp8 family phage protein